MAVEEVEPINRTEDPLLVLAVKVSMNPGPGKRASQRKKCEDPIEDLLPPEKGPKNTAVEERPLLAGMEAWWVCKLAVEGAKKVRRSRR